MFFSCYDLFMFPEQFYCMCVPVNLLSGSKNLKPCWMAYTFLYVYLFSEHPVQLTFLLVKGYF